uniref:Putative secreted protein n=1 Tax=Anopheles triannulatus TaxID=58253 RepID=A0A2M4B889_9DIPT
MHRRLPMFGQARGGVVCLLLSSPCPPTTTTMAATATKMMPQYDTMRAKRAVELALDALPTPPCAMLCSVSDELAHVFWSRCM